MTSERETEAHNEQCIKALNKGLDIVWELNKNGNPEKGIKPGNTAYWAMHFRMKDCLNERERLREEMKEDNNYRDK